MLEPWRILYAIEENKRIYKLDEEKIDEIYIMLSQIEAGLSACYFRLGKYDKSSDCFDKAVVHANKVKCEKRRINLIFVALVGKGNRLVFQQEYNEAKTVYEELYNLVAEAYYVDHPLVLKAANYLIEFLIQIEEYEDAERYARITYECLTRPFDTESMDVADAAQYLANVTYKLICRDGAEDSETMEAEMLSRKSLRIKEKLYGTNHCIIVNSKICLSNVLSIEGNHDDERKLLLEQCLAINIRRYGIDNVDTAIVNTGLANFHKEIARKLPHGNARTEQLRISDLYRKEQLRINKLSSDLSRNPT
jgi:tetratricopeptide (TPR) repeat protein